MLIDDASGVDEAWRSPLSGYSNLNAPQPRTPHVLRPGFTARIRHVRSRWKEQHVIRQQCGERRLVNFEDQRSGQLGIPLSLPSMTYTPRRFIIFLGDVSKSLREGDPGS